MGGGARPEYSARALHRKARNPPSCPASLPRSGVTFSLQSLQANECLFVFFFHPSPSRPCCSDIRQGNSGDNFRWKLRLGKVPKVRIAHSHSSLTILLRLLDPLRGIPSASTSTPLRFAGTCVSAFSRTGLAQHKTAAVASARRSNVTFDRLLSLLSSSFIVPYRHHCITHSQWYMFILCLERGSVSRYDFLYIVMCTQVHA